jgi:hypothetical protein
MITCIIKGGLGNQLFQIFALLSYVHKYNLNSWYILYTDNVGNRPSYWNTIFFKLHYWLRNRHYTNMIIFNEEQIDKYNTKTFRNIITKNHIILNGYFQNYKYFEDVYNIIYNLLDINTWCMKILIKYTYDYKSTTSIHFRYGDYKLLRDHFNILEYTYYSREKRKYNDFLRRFRRGFQSPCSFFPGSTRHEMQETNRRSDVCRRNERYRPNRRSL